jgi:cobalt/nickel transport system permease protein
MHIPDNFLSPPVWASLDCIAAPAVAIVSRRAQKSANTNQLPLLGVLGAFVFAAQMVNFPVGIGTSGHLVGGTLLACIIGPWAAALVMTSILVIQALVFQDGGVLALGPNVINMALLGVLAGYLPARLLAPTRWSSFGIFMGGTLSVLVSGVLALSELLLSGIRMSTAMIELSLVVFAVNALIEGAITLSVLRAIERLKPGVTVLGVMQPEPASRPRKLRTLVVAVGSVSVAIAALGVAIGSNLPDGLERLALRLDIPFAAHPVLHAPLSDYYVRELGINWASRASAGLLGLFCIYAVCGIGSHLLGRSRRSYS